MADGPGRRSSAWILLSGVCLALVLGASAAVACSGIPGACGTRSCGPGVSCPDPGAPGTPGLPQPGAPGTPGLPQPSGPVDPYPPRYKYIIACSGNVGGANDVLCVGAATTCPDFGIRFWGFVSRWDGTAYGPFRRTGAVCLGPEAAAAVDPLAGVLAQVREQWRSLGLPGAAVTTRPEGQTLVNAVTLFASPAQRELDLPPVQILGVAVTLRLRAVEYRWEFGDGTTSTVTPSQAPAQTEHVYRRPGSQPVTLRTTYTATFTLAGSDVVYPLDGTADVTGPVTQLVAREARTQLEAGPG